MHCHAGQTRLPAGQLPARRAPGSLPAASAAADPEASSREKEREGEKESACYARLTCPPLPAASPQDMVRRGCERNVITYSSLISACEKAGRWELALQLFREMHAEGCRPNVVTYNSLIAACAQGERSPALLLLRPAVAAL